MTTQSRFTFAREAEDSIATTRAKHQLMRRLYSGLGGIEAGDQAVRWGRQQVDRSGVQRGTNKPDASYVSTGGQRVNIEMDTDPRRSLAHSTVVNKRDPNARNIYLIIHPVTGQVIGGRVRMPGRPERLLTDTELSAIRAGRGSVIPRPRPGQSPGAARQPRIYSPAQIEEIQRRALQQQMSRRRATAVRPRTGVSSSPLMRRPPTRTRLRSLSSPLFRRQREAEWEFELEAAALEMEA